MKDIVTKKASLFIASLLMIAAGINSFFDHFFACRLPPPSPPPALLQQRPTQPSAASVPRQKQNQEHIGSPVSALERQAEPPGPRQKTPEELAAEHARFLALYLNTRDALDPSIKTAAIAVTDENAKYNPVVTTALATRLKPERLKVLSNLFTPAFVSDGLFNDAFDGSAKVVETLDLRSYVHLLLLARQTVQYSRNAGLEDVITANMRLDVNALPVGAWGQNQGWTFTAKGAGFRPADARSMAEERLLKQIARYNFVLDHFSTNAQ